jgi:tRNA-splicing ligase RtcB (3'-phosphate/5'-hydroxy nucleic acid ligase)
MTFEFRQELRRIDEYRWELPRTGAMRVPGRIYGTRKLVEFLREEGSLRQVANVAALPGILGASLAMPDAHQGYGFTIGGVAAFDWDEGVVSPGGVGYDINCGVRLARTHLTEDAVRPRLEDLANELFRSVPSGVGATGPVRLDKREEKRVLTEGARWAVDRGFGEAADLDRTEDGGRMAGADPDVVGDRALERGRKQLGTLGSGNHFLEVGVVDAIFDEAAAGAFGLFLGQVTVMIHTGSRGFGHQVCDDFLARMNKAAKKLPFELPDPQLACAPIASEAGRDYLAAMACAANYAWANRQILLHRSREVFQRTLGIGPRDLGMRMVYDVCHNVAKREIHEVDGKRRVVCVHRKGATRSFPKGHPDIPAVYRAAGQPVLVPGDMGTASYVLAGTETAMAETFGSTSHGAGRLLSRKAAKKAAKGRAIGRELEDRGIRVKWTGRATLSEEMPDAYKDIEEVVAAVHGAGLSRKVARLRPVAVVKG